MRRTLIIAILIAALTAACNGLGEDDGTGAGAGGRHDATTREGESDD